MDYLIGELIVELFFGFFDKMSNRKYPRWERLIYFLIFYASLFVPLILLGVVIYDETNAKYVTSADILFALSAFFFFFCGRQAWYGKKTPPSKKGKNAEERPFSLKSAMLDKRIPLKRKILIFLLAFAPFYAIPILIAIFFQEMGAIVAPTIVLIAMLNIACAVVVFKK